MDDFVHAVALNDPPEIVQRYDSFLRTSWAFEGELTKEACLEHLGNLWTDPNLPVYT